MATETELFDAWSSGDLDAGQTLFERHFRSIRRFFGNKVGPQDVEDLVQRTFLACVESRDRFRGDCSFRTYLFVVARHELYGHLRKRAKDVVAAGLDVGASSVADLGTSPSRVVGRRQEHELIAQALQRIPVNQQVLLELYYWEEIPGPELALVMEVEPTTVRTRLHRARAALREQLDKLTKTPATEDQLDAWTRQLQQLV